MATTPDRRVTESGIEVKPVYGPDDAPGPAEPPGAFPFTRGPVRGHVPRPPVDDAPVRGFRLGRGDEPRASGRCSGAARPASRSRSTCRRSSATTRTTPSPRARSGGPASRSTRSRTCGASSTGIPLDEVSTSMTINAPAALLLLCYELVAAERGVPGDALRGTVQNDVLKEYVARGNYIFPPRPSMRLTTDLFAYCAERIPRWNTISISGLPHPRGGLDGGAGARVHARERHRLLRGGGRGGPLARRVRRAALLLLQRAQRRAPGGREVPRGPAAVGGDHARPVRRDEREGAGAPLPRPDRRLDAHRAAAREQPRPGRRAGAVGDLRRRAVDPHERLRRGARAPDRAGGHARAADAAGADARGGDDATRPTRSAARGTSRR